MLLDFRQHQKSDCIQASGWPEAAWRGTTRNGAVMPDKADEYRNKSMECENVPKRHLQPFAESF